MADMGKSIKNIWAKGITAIGNTANNIASNTRFKLEEMNIVNRRNEILSDFGNKAYALWQKGVHFPKEMEDELEELSLLDEKLNALRVDHYSSVKTNDDAPGAEGGQPAEKETQWVPADFAAPAEQPEQEAADFTALVEEPEQAPAGEDAAVPVIRVENPTAAPESAEAPAERRAPLSEEISQLFSRDPSVDGMADKVNSALDSLGETLKDFSDQVDKGLSELDDTLNGPKK